MIAFLPEYNGQACDFTGKPMTRAVGHFARGATGRVCLVLVGEHSRGDLIRSKTMEEIREWAESVPNGYLDY